jgi:hypothetical protein
MKSATVILLVLVVAVLAALLWSVVPAPASVVVVRDSWYPWHWWNRRWPQPGPSPRPGPLPPQPLPVPDLSPHLGPGGMQHKFGPGGTQRFYL